MTRAQAKKLRPGDEVYWKDPDEGACSRYIQIQRIEVNDDVATITDLHGGEVECFLRELS